MLDFGLTSSHEVAVGWGCGLVSGLHWLWGGPLLWSLAWLLAGFGASAQGCQQDE